MVTVMHQETLDGLHLVNLDLSFLVQRILRSCHHRINFTSVDHAVGPLNRWPLSVSGSKYLCRDILALLCAEAGTHWNIFQLPSCSQEGTQSIPRS